MKRLLLAALAAAALPCAALAAPVSTEVEISGGTAPLKATLLKPEGAKPGGPVVVILPGSGPTNRDGDNAYRFKPGSYRLLAEGLADNGVASIRMDKRGMFANAAAAADPNRVFLDQLAADALAWADKARAETGAPCAWLAGHSEGAVVALIAGQSGKNICGLILISGPGRPLDVVIAEQLKANPANAPLLAQALPALTELKAGRKVDTSAFPPVLMPLFHPAIQDFLINAFSKDPAALIGAYKGQVLILQGTTDAQVTLVDAKALKAAQPKATLVTLEGVNHMLKVAPMGDMTSYTDPSLPLAPGVVSAIVDFIKP